MRARVPSDIIVLIKEDYCLCFQAPSGLGAGVIAVIVICILLLIIIAVLLVLVWKKKSTGEN